MNRNMARSYNRQVITEQWREGGSYVIDFAVGQSFGKPQARFWCSFRTSRDLAIVGLMLLQGLRSPSC